MRLIDADELKYVIHCAYSDDLEILEKIDEQPTVFDVDKVVEQLEELKMRYFLTIANTGDKKHDIAYENVGNALDKPTLEIDREKNEVTIKCNGDTIKFKDDNVEVTRAR